MTDEQLAHVRLLSNRITRDMAAKYERGQREHGGNLWDRNDLVQCAIDEAIDLLVYLYTLRDQQVTLGGGSQRNLEAQK